MQDNLVDHFDALATWRSALRDDLRAFADFLSANELLGDGDAAAADALAARLGADKLVLACVAEVSRGKSELLNAIFFADAGLRVLPATPGRTTMCPVELHFDAARPAELLLLPIDTRLDEQTLAEWRARPSAWQRLSLDPRHPESLVEATRLVTQTQRVEVARARALGLWHDEQPQDNAPLGADGLVEVPVWRHALINYPHPMLERGLVVLDTPGLNAVGAEPELTLSLLPSAHAIVFVLGADTGVSRSDLAMWNELPGADALERFVVLNKVDILADPLSTPQAVAAAVQTQRRQIADTLGVPLQRVFALSARDALAARVNGDAPALARSGLSALEDALAEELLPRRRALLERSATALLIHLRHGAKRRIGDRRRQVTEQLLELRGLRGKSGAKVRALLQRLDVEEVEFNRCQLRLSALRVVHAKMLRRAQHELSSDGLRREVALMRRAVDAMPMKLGARKAFRELCARVRASLAAATAQFDEIVAMLDAGCKALNAEFGFALTPVAAPALQLHAAELDAIERSYSQYLGPAQVWRLAGGGFTEQFQRMLLSKLRMVFESAGGDIEAWSKGIGAQMERQLHDRREAFVQRRDALQRIQFATGELEQRITEVEAQDVRFGALQLQLDAVAGKACAQALHSGQPAAVTPGHIDETLLQSVDG